MEAERTSPTGSKLSIVILELGIVVAPITSPDFLNAASTANQYIDQAIAHLSELAINAILEVLRSVLPIESFNALVEFLASIGEILTDANRCIDDIIRTIVDSIGLTPGEANQIRDLISLLGKVKGAAAIIGSVLAKKGLKGVLVSRSGRPKPKPRGGTYKLVDERTGQVMRTGRTNNLTSRKGDHRRDLVLGKYRFDVDELTDDFLARRGLEQMLHDRYNPPLNKIRAVDPRRRALADTYRKAAEKHLKESQK